MAVVFSRFPRMLRELAGRLGKQVELNTQDPARAVTDFTKPLIEAVKLVKA